MEGENKYLDEIKQKLNGYYYPFELLKDNQNKMNELFSELIDEYRKTKSEREQLEQQFENFINRQLSEEYEEKDMVNELLKKNKMISELRQHLKSKLYKERNLLENIIKLSEFVIQSPEKMQNIMEIKDKIEVEMEKLKLKQNQEEQMGISISGLTYQDLVNLSKEIFNNKEGQN